MKWICCTLALAAVLCLAPAPPLVAQSLTAGPQIQLAPTGWKGVQGPTLASGPDRGFLSSWVDGGALNLRAFSPDGAPLGLTRQLSPSSARPTSSDLAALGPNRYVVVWAQGSLRGQILDAAGAPVGPQLVLADRAVDFFVSAEPIGGGFVIAWMNAEPSIPYKFQIKVRRFDAQGAPASAIFVVTPAGSFPSIAALPDGGFAVAWVHGDSTNPSTVFSIRARTFRADGTPAGPETTFPEPAGDVIRALRVSADATGRWVVAWTEFPTLQNNYQVKAWRFSSTGQPLGSPILVAEPEGEGRISYIAFPSMRPDGSFLVSWEESNELTGGPSNIPGDSMPIGADVRARAFDAAGVPLGPDFLVHPSAEGEQHLGDVDATADGWIIGWRRRLDPQAGVYARRFTLSCGTGAQLCLNNGRFLAEVAWRVPATGQSGTGTPIARTSDTGAFWFFSPSNYELLVKVLDGTGINRHFWVFYGSLTDVEFDLKVTDTLAGLQRTYHNPAGTMASRSDTEAF